MALYLETIRFSESERDAWRDGSCEQLACSSASSFLKGILQAKASIRPHLFFGEAYAAIKIPHEDGWYSSYNWLNSDIWTDSSKPTGEYQARFKLALGEHFPQLRQLQARARIFARELGEEPVPPDLWLIRNHEHWFIETKIPPDRVSAPQLAGLALIATCLPSEKKVTVGVVYLQNEFAKRNPIPGNIESDFARYRNRLMAG